MLLFILLLFFICRCFSFCCCIFIWFPGYFAMSPALYPGFSDLRRPPPALSSTPTTFYCFFFHLPQALRFWVGIFYPHTGVFYLMFFPNIFGTSQHFWHISDILAQPTFTKVLLGAGSHFLESCRASYWSSKHRPGPSLYLIQSNPQSFIHLTFLFMHVNIAKVFTCGENFDKKYRSAAKLISNHENIKQQPN